MKCGLSEDGWSCGYLFLRHKDVVALSRDEVCALSTVFIEDEYEGPLLRKEITLAELIAKKLGIGAAA